MEMKPTVMTLSNQESILRLMIDASHSAFDENIHRTKAVVEKAHQRQVFVEAELGVLSGVEDDISIDEKKAKYTDPSECVAFVKENRL